MEKCETNIIPSDLVKRTELQLSIAPTEVLANTSNANVVTYILLKILVIECVVLLRGTTDGESYSSSTNESCKRFAFPIAREV